MLIVVMRRNQRRVRVTNNVVQRRVVLNSGDAPGVVETSTTSPHSSATSWLRLPVELYRNVRRKLKLLLSAVDRYRWSQAGPRVPDSSGPTHLSRRYSHSACVVLLRVVP
ncbi:unnamed protein product [Rangifer tarandus platyrhynchus]|uniref:Uncharacterized protein n=1 Tax=Rangifer tarandus platyrhynchus TaxID=3082113 RepID=A0ABN8XKV3_RANTA|nr:unnamed protein product [Rangifer tarandus platyrhynchus]